MCNTAQLFFKFRRHEVSLSIYTNRCSMKIFATVVDALMQARQRYADRKIEQFIRASGGRLTNEAEREMMRRLTSTWSFRP